MKCGACGFENAPGARFCGRCGQALELRCPTCGEAVAPGLAFCTSCGARLDGEAPAAAAGREERKIVTVLFCDLVGFTTRAEQLDPEDVRRVLSPFYARLRAELERFGGTVEKFIGDAVMALFGAPVAHEDDPERAVRAALAIREAVTGLNEENPGLDLQVRIAVNTGEAMIALGANPSEGEGMAAGDVVNTAARMQSAAPVGGILVGESTYRATRQAIEYRDAEPMVAKGKAEPVPVWEAIAARWRFGVDVAQLGGSELVGRGEELDLLRDALNRARRERASQLVTLIGEPGIGKSRLVYELFKAVDAEPDLTYWRQGRSLPYGEGVTFWALSEMGKSHAGILETDSAEAAEEKLRQAVAEAIPDPVDVEWALGHLRPLVGLGGNVELTSDSRTEVFAAWRKFFEAIAEKRPLVLVFEDLQWADEGLLDFVDHLVEWASGVPLLCVCTARPELLERRPDWGGGKRNATTVSLSRLSDEETARLVHALLGTAVLPAELQSTLLARASGNPLYAEEFARLVEERSGSEGELPLPESVQGIIAARIDGLPAEEKEILQDAAVVGKVVWVGTVAALGDIPRWTVEERLHALERTEFVRREQRSTVESETEYAFRHVLVRDVAYGQIPRSARAAKHRLVAEWIVSIGERTEDRAEMLAHHYLSALEFARASGQPTEALAGPARTALREAGDRAWGLSSPVTAKRFYENALELWPPEEPGRAKLLFRYGRALRIADDHAADEILAEARDALLAEGDRETAAEAETVRAEFSWYLGRPAEALDRLEQASGLVEDVGPSGAKIRVLAERARLELFAGRTREAIEIGREALRMAEVLEDDQPRAELLNTIGVARFFADESDRGGVEDLEQSVAIARTTAAPETLVRSLFNVAETRMMLGDARASRELFEELREVTRRFGLETFDRWQRGAEPGILYLHGRWDEAASRAEEFIAEVDEGSPHYQEGNCRIARGKIRLGRSEVQGALEDARRGADFARAAGDHQLLQPILSFSAWVHAVVGESAEASALTDEVLELGPFVSVYVADLAWAMRELGRGGEFLERALPELPEGKEPTLWRVAARAVASGELERAAEVFGEIGSAPDEAYARLVAAEGGGSSGAELERALAFFREVGATAYLERGEALLAKSA
jgi:class 3 adenylate cyclase/tetratricopeptide (TPR) repeat protein